MPPKPISMSDTRSSNARAHSAPVHHNTNRASHVGNANIWSQSQFVAPGPPGPPQTTPPSSLMGPPTMIPPSTTGQTQGRSDIQARFDEIYFTSPLPRSISNIYNTLQTQPQAALSSQPTMAYQQQSTPVPQAHPGASQSYHALAQNMNPNTRFRSITQAATQTFAAARQLANAPTQTFSGVGPLSATGPGTATVSFQTYTTENGIKVYVGPFANAYAYFGLTPPNTHTTEMARQSNNTRAGENTRVTGAANTLASASTGPVTPPRPQRRSPSPSPAYSPVLAPVLELQKLASPLKKSVTPEPSKAKRKSQQKAKATESESEPITQALEVQQEAKPSNELVAPGKAKIDVKGKGKAKQMDSEPGAVVFDLSGTKNTINSRTQPKVAAATDKSVTTPETAAAVKVTEKVIEQKQMPENVAPDTQLITTSKPELDVEQVKKKGKAVEAEKRLQAMIRLPHSDSSSSGATNRSKETLRTSQPVNKRTTRSRENVPKAKNRTETEPEALEVERSSSRRISGRATVIPRPWWVAGSTSVSVAPVRAKKGSLQPPSVNGKRKRSARMEEQDEQATEQPARRSRTRRSASGIVQSDTMEHPSVNKSAQEEKASTREDQAIQGQIIDVIQEHGTTTAANGSDDESIKSGDKYQYTRNITPIQEYHSPAATTSANDSEPERVKDEDEYLHDIIQEHNGQNAAAAAYGSEEVSVKVEGDEYEAYQTSDGLDESITGDENNWEQGMNESQRGEEDLVDYDDLPQSPPRPNYPGIGLYPPNHVYYDVAYDDEDDSPEYPNYMRRQARRYDDDVQSRSPQYSEGGYQPQDSESEYQPQSFNDGSSEYSDLPENHLFENECQKVQLSPDHRYHLEMQGAIFDSSSSVPFQSPCRGRTLLQGTKRPFTGLSPGEPRGTPPPREPSISPRKRKRLLWRKDGEEELIHPDSPRYLPLPLVPLSSPGRGRTLRKGTRRAWTGLSPNGPRKTPPPRKRSLTPRPRKRLRHLHRQGEVDELIELPSSPSSLFYSVSASSRSLSEEYDGFYQPTEREMRSKTLYINLVSDSDSDTPHTPPPRVSPSTSSGSLSEEYDGFYQPTERELRGKLPYIDLVSDSSDSDTPRTPPPRVWPNSNVMGKRNLKNRATGKYNFRRSRTVEAKKETDEVQPNGNGASSESTSKSKGRKTPQPPNRARVTRSGAVGKIARGKK